MAAPNAPTDALMTRETVARHRQVWEDQVAADAVGLTVRAMVHDDVPRVIELLTPIAETSFLEWEDAALLAAHLEANDALSFVAEVPDGLVGAIIAGSVGVRGTISHIAVASAYRRRGVARSLVQQALAGFRAHGLRRVFLFAGSANRPAQRFWTDCGFLEIETETTWELDI